MSGTPTVAPPTAALFTDLLDDAALFLPGNATMPAITAYLRSRHSDDAAFIGSFLCPSKRLDELRAALLDDVTLDLALTERRSRRGWGTAGQDAHRRDDRGRLPRATRARARAARLRARRRAVQADGWIAQRLPAPGLDDRVRHHGFLNVMAAVASATDGGELPEVASLLEVIEFSMLTQWAATVPRAEVTRVRALFVGFGPCSTDEPLADLRTLGLLPERSV